jgi:hypothetical protein
VYENDKIKHWEAKYMSLDLITTFSDAQFKGSHGIEYFKTLSVFEAHILPDLQTPVDGTIHSLVKVATMKCLVHFLSQVNIECFL